MATVNIPCPKCGKELKLRDRSLLGKKGRCPSCQHTFVLQEPDEVEFELAEAAPAPVPAAGGPLVGTAARWVPDGAPSTPAAASVMPQRAAAPSPFGVSVEDLPTDPTAAITRKRAGKRNVGTILGTVAGVLIVGAAVGYYAMAPQSAGKSAGGSGGGGGGEKAGPAVAMPAVEPLPKGEPIDLKMAPLGARFLINLRPAELWKKNSQGEEFRFCLGPLGEWLDTKIKELTKFEPTEIEELLFCVVPNAQGEAPSVSGVVRLAEDHKRSEMITKFEGESKVESGYPAYVGKEWSYVIEQDSKRNFAFCPTSSLPETIAAMKEPSSTDGGIEELLRETDRSRHVTVVFRPDDLRTHHPDLVGKSLLPFAGQVVDWFNPDEIDAVAWSLHLADKHFHSDFQIRNKTARAVTSLERDFRKRIDQLPEDLLHAVEMMEPSEMGKRQIIGRFPAMLAVASVETDFSAGKRTLKMSTVLPERAAPNLALGSLLAWDESTRTDFNKTPKKPDSKSQPTGGGAETILAKLGKSIEIDFRKEPLQGAFKYISDETGAAVDIDGDALKMAGYTKNMAQDIKLGNVPAMTAIREIVSKYKDKVDPTKDMCIYINEQKKLFMVTTKAGAKKDGQTPVDFGAK
jgi:hypothetical protein